MGLGASHRGGSAPSHRAEPLRRRRPSIRRTISSFILCGASPSSSHVMEDFPAGVLMTSAENGDGERLKNKRKGSDLPPSRRAAPVDIRVSSGRCMTGDEIAALETVPGNVGPGDKEKYLYESESVISCQSTPDSSNDGTASTSCIVHPSPDCVSVAEIADFDAANSITSRDSSQIFEPLSDPDHLPSHCYGESSLDEVSAGNDIAESIDSYSEDSSSFFHDSPAALHLMQDDNLRVVMPSTAEFIVLGREEQDRQQGALRQGDLMSVSSSSLMSASSNSHDIRNYTSFSFSRNTVFSTDGSNFSRSPDGSHHDFSTDFFSDSLQGSGIHGSNELGWNSRSEFWERFHGSLDTTDTPTDVCPRRIHSGSSCLCRSGLSAEEPGSRAIPRIVLLAQTLFEVLDQIHQQPMSVSLSMVSRPAPESVVASLPVKIQGKEKILECEEDISQCHICLGAYEEGDKIRVLPCQHEYHMSCVDKWLKEVHGVCPLCRGDVCKGVTEANLDIIPH